MFGEVQQGGIQIEVIGGRPESKPPRTLRMAETNRGRGAIRQGTTDHLYFEQGRPKLFLWYGDHLLTA